MPDYETPDRIEPALLDDIPPPIADAIAELSALTAQLGSTLHPSTSANLASVVRIMNTYYSNLIEGHNTRPRDIERALAGEMEAGEERRNLQLEAVAHIRVQTELDRMASRHSLPEPSSCEFIRWLHREFYKDAPEALLRVGGPGRELLMTPGQWRSRPEEDVAVGRHVPPSSDRVPAFMEYFETRYRFDRLGRAGRIAALAAAHHRFNYIHPFPDGNGRVSRLMSHAMAHAAGIGAHGMWPISRGLARGLESRGEYKRMMDHADMPRQGDLDGRGNLSLRALSDFVLWFLKVCIDQVAFMSSLFELGTLSKRLRAYVKRNDDLQPEAAGLLDEALFRGEFERGAAGRITGLPERTARRVLNKLVSQGLLASAKPKAPVSLRFPVATLDQLFPRLYPES
jgi:Fic family protein